ncbi:uncharacterized protein MKZ38_002073 [Zalerion maritima]|uniref:Ankyrin n=1 Tax=Zalerion maritima TaxID=339359 RepID=A0AAD5RYV6_9PEZI|nr:uncharacterized protein MKZ38_002073 [Zalerion maritima]
MDVLSAIALADHCSSLCITAGKELRRCFRDAKYANQDIQTLLNRLNKVKGSSDILRLWLLELKKSKIHDLEYAVPFDQKAFEDTIKQIRDLASRAAKGQSRLGIIQKLGWVAQKRTSEKLIAALEEEQRSLWEVTSGISGLEDILQENTTAIEKLDVNDGDAFSDAATLVQTSGTQPHTTSMVHPMVGVKRTWLGHILTDDHDNEYNMVRHQLSEAAFQGDWEIMFKALDIGAQEYGESWVNAIRMKPLSHSDQMSFWTPLHQAVYNNASVDVIRRLIEMGASRTLRSRYTEFSQLDMSPLELAHDLQMFHLYDILSPTIRWHIPSRTLAVLEKKFDDIIRQDLGDYVGERKLYLPALELCTEFEPEPIWFPVKLPGRQSAGYLYRVEGRELVVRVFNLPNEGDARTYRVAEDGIFDIGQALPGSP